jgi:hypothetical protein
MTDLSGLGRRNPDPAAEARNQLISVITAARAGEMQLAATLVTEYGDKHGGDILPLLISSVSFIESILISVSDAMDITAETLFSGICLGISVRAIEEQQGKEPDA